MMGIKMNKLYCVFISSTYDDLVEYRQKVIDVIQRLECHPITMEYFGANPSPSIQLCYDKLQEADIFIGIYAHRYGFTPPKGATYKNCNGEYIVCDGQKSLVQLEYEWAFEREIPILPFIIDNSIERDLKYKDDGEIAQHLRDFLNVIQSRHVRDKFNSPENLAVKVSTSLGNFLKKVQNNPKENINFHTQQINESYIPPKLTPEQLQAAHDENRLVRLIAPPGTGKTLVIEERVRWLLSRGIDADKIAVISFTRASSRDLEKRLQRFCGKDFANVESVRVSTLHSLALRIVRTNSPSGIFATNPNVLDEWELKNIFDDEFVQEYKEEFNKIGKILNKTCAKGIRNAWEIFWDTGEWDYQNGTQNPIDEFEKTCFYKFYEEFRHFYSCVLPGELVKASVDLIRRGNLDPTVILDIEHLIVDEFQDLNKTDLEFIDFFVTNNVNIFIAGDDNQSIYSFRHAFPMGILEFSDKYSDKYSNVSSHTLLECFRCPPQILKISQDLIKIYSTPKAEAKYPFSFCQNFTPYLSGVVKNLSFKSPNTEFKFIAESCQKLIEQGLKPRDILILISKKRLIDTKLIDRLSESLNISFETPTGERFVDTNSGRFIYALVRIICDKESKKDYIAHRTILGLFKRVSTRICINIKRKLINNNVNFLSFFYETLSSITFYQLDKTAVDKLKNLCHKLTDFQSENTFSEIKTLIEQELNENYPGEVDKWINYTKLLPDEISIDELRNYLATDNSDQQEAILRDLYLRLGLEIPLDGILPQQIRIMTMHGAKGLNADVVFIPSMEDEVLPGEKRLKATGLVNEGARMFYVSITRARVACVISYSKTRFNHELNKNKQQDLSRYCQYIGNFILSENPISDEEVQNIISSKELYQSHTNTRLNQM